MIGQGGGTYGPGPTDWSAPLPVGVFLDSSVVAYLERFADVVWEGAALSNDVPDQLRRQIDALRVLML